MNNVGDRPGSFRDNLKAVLHEKRLSHQAAAELTGYSRQSISFWVEGRHEPSIKDIPGIAAALGVPAERLLIGPRSQRVVDRGLIVGAVHPHVVREIDEDLQTHLIEVGSRLKMFRDALEIDLAECCEALNVLPEVWLLWERGEGIGDPLILVEFCNRYGCTMDWIERGEIGSLADKTRTAMRKLDQRTPEDLARARRRRHNDRSASALHSFAAAG